MTGEPVTAGLPESPFHTTGTDLVTMPNRNAEDEHVQATLEELGLDPQPYDLPDTDNGIGRVTCSR